MNNLKIDMKADSTPSSQAVEKAMNILLEGAFWPAKLEPKVAYSRRQDDTDGDTGADQNLSVMFGPDADGYVTVGWAQVLRFRETFCGGGQSPRVRNALLVLAEAIRRDNEELPQKP